MNVSDPTLVVCEIISPGFNLVKNLLWRSDKMKFLTKTPALQLKERRYVVFRAKRTTYR